MARKNKEINIIVHLPKDEKSKQELTENVASIHALIVTEYIKKLNCPYEQKIELIDAIIEKCKAN